MHHRLDAVAMGGVADLVAGLHVQRVDHGARRQAQSQRQIRRPDIDRVQTGVAQTPPNCQALRGLDHRRDNDLVIGVRDIIAAILQAAHRTDRAHADR